MGRRAKSPKRPAGTPIRPKRARADRRRDRGYRLRLRRGGRRCDRHCRVGQKAEKIRETVLRRASGDRRPLCARKGAACRFLRAMTFCAPLLSALFRARRKSLTSPRPKFYNREKAGQGTMETSKNVAVLIDAENVPATYAKQIFDEASNYGNIVVKRIFADWSKASVKGWKDEVNRNSMTAVQQFEVQPRKNTIDIALIIQALIILFEKDVDVFCIAAGDSDYTRLVRETARAEQDGHRAGRAQRQPEFCERVQRIYLPRTRARARRRRRAPPKSGAGAGRRRRRRPRRRSPPSPNLSTISGAATCSISSTASSTTAARRTMAQISVEMTAEVLRLCSPKTSGATPSKNSWKSCCPTSSAMRRARRQTGRRCTSSKK